MREGSEAFLERSCYSIPIGNQGESDVEMHQTRPCSTLSYLILTVAIGVTMSCGAEAQTADEKARTDLISRIQAVPASPRYAVQAAAHGTPAISMGMDTAKVIQVDRRFYAVYSPNSKSVKLAFSSNPDGPWTEITS